LLFSLYTPARESCSEDGNSDREVAGGSGGQEKPSARERRRTTTKRKTVHGGAKKKKKEKDPYAFILGTWDPDVDDAAAFDKYLAQMGAFYKSLLCTLNHNVRIWIGFEHMCQD
jgi:hypothetical protein